MPEPKSAGEQDRRAIPPDWRGVAGYSAATMMRCQAKCPKCFLPCVLEDGLSTHEHDAYTKRHFHWAQRRRSIDDPRRTKAHIWETEYELGVGSVKT